MSSSVGSEVIEVGNHEDEKKTAETSSSNYPIALYEIACEGLCTKKYPPELLFECQHPECKTEQPSKLLCESCSAMVHQWRKSHPFSTKSCESLWQKINPVDEAQYQEGLLVGSRLAKKYELLQKFIWNQRWHMAGSTVSLATSFSASVGSAMFCTKSNLCAPSIASNMPTGVGIGTAIEWCYVWHRYSKKQISGQEAIALGASSLVANMSAASIMLKASAITDQWISSGAINPWVAMGGCVLTAITAGILVRGGVDELWKKHFGNETEEEKNRSKLQKEALNFFFNDASYDIHDSKKFNEKILRRRYHRLSLIYYPDRELGDKQKWLELCGHYGILTGICEYSQSSKPSEQSSDTESKTDPDPIE